ncbi:DUF3375 family protein [Brevibacterium luteolum]|uniref:DUF3375 family protein n=1 Tax=Brevibacterium luteolum TaxID=199591 RepID=UPI001C234FCE|nr:DUF3375 family protein [Brevibacterium luteolum]MBU8579994.1 DUF3375 domain-containing protein [Brevibacterium luteolum]
MATDIETDLIRVEQALETPTLKLLDRKSARIVLPVFATLFQPGSSDPIPVERFHARLDAMLNELAALGHDVPKTNGRQLAMQWMRERWLYRDPGKGEETYRPTAHAEQALDYISRVTRNQINVSASRIETIQRVVSDAAMLANPNREERIRRLDEEIARLAAERERLADGGELAPVSDSELIEQFSNVLRELDSLPSDFRRVEESVRVMHKDITQRFREEDRPIGQVIDDYLTEASHLFTDTAEGRAFTGARDLLHRRDLLNTLRQDLSTILQHPTADALTDDEARKMRTATKVIRRGINGVLLQRQRLSATLREYIENYDHIRNRELDETLRGIDQQLRLWMQHATVRDQVDIELIPSTLELDMLKLRTFDPDNERAPEPLADVTAEAPEVQSLEEVRQQGGPSLTDLRQRITSLIDSDEHTPTAAVLFNDLPDDLKRPVEILGILHLFAQLDAELDVTHPELVTSQRPDGTYRSFLIPRSTLPEREGDTHD